MHWTFLLLVLYAAISTWQWMHDPKDVMVGAMGAAYAVAQLLTVFFCITLHEYGHCLTARRFGISTQDITLLPIGGVARLQRMPRVPWQELVVAVAGPAVNVVIAAGMLFGFWAFGHWDGLMQLVPVNSEAIKLLMIRMQIPTSFGFALSILAVNIMLVLFNMIPAFPMDGGRVFRSLAAMVMDYRQATWLASRVGLVIGVILAMVALSYNRPMPVIIAIFIGYAGIQEAKQVEAMELVRGLFVKDVMIHSPPSISMDAAIDEIHDFWHSAPLATVPVVDRHQIFVGTLSIADFTKKLKENPDPKTITAGLIANHDAISINQDAELSDDIMMAGARYIFVVNDAMHLVGVLDFSVLRPRSNWVRLRLNG